MGALRTGGSTQHGYPARSTALFTLLTLFFVNLTGYLDRQIVTLLVQPIKLALGLSDGMIGLMQGAGFVFAYALAGLLIGGLVDRRSRRNILIVCVLVWSASAAAGGLAHNGVQLFLARMGVGIGEAALIPAAVSLIADTFRRDRRGWAMGIFTVSVYAGSGLSLMIVGLALPAITRWAAQLAAAGTHVEVWRLVLFLMLLPGLFVTALLLGVREPPRIVVGDPGVGRSATLRNWWARASTFLPHHLAFAFISVSQFAIAAWLPTILIREHHLDVRQAALVFGGMAAAAGGCGAFLSGPIGDRLSRHSRARGRIAVCSYALPVAALAVTALFFVDDLFVLVPAVALVFGLQALMIVVGILAGAEMAPPHASGQVTAIHMAFSGIIGSAGGPALVGFLNDALHSRGFTLSEITGGTCLFGIVLGFVLVQVTLVRMARRDRTGLDAVAGEILSALDWRPVI